MSYDYLFKIISVGDAAVGKTAFISHLTKRIGTRVYDPTVGVDFATKLTYVGEEKLIKSHIWDTAGQECFAPIIRSYYRDSAGVILMFDLTRRRTFESLDRWLDELERTRLAERIGTVILVGTKLDKGGRQVSEAEASQYAASYGLRYFETSGVYGDNVDISFHLLIEDVFRRMEANQGAGIKMNAFKEQGLAVPPVPEGKKKRKCCAVS